MSEPRKRRTEITIEKHEVTVFRHRRWSSGDFCVVCRAAVTSFTFEEAAAMLSTDVQAIAIAVYAGAMHSTSQGTRPFRICGLSITGNFKHG